MHINTKISVNIEYPYMQRVKIKELSPCTLMGTWSLRKKRVELNRLRFSRFNFKIKRKKETLSEESLVGKIITKVKNHAASIQLIITNTYHASKYKL